MLRLAVAAVYASSCAVALQPPLAATGTQRRTIQHAGTLDDVPDEPRVDRRAALIGGGLLAVSAAASGEPKPYDYGLWGVLPVGPYKAKRSAPLETIVPGQVWTVDQKFGILNVQVLQTASDTTLTSFIRLVAIGEGAGCHRVSRRSQSGCRS